jgi:hypothetical protein
MTSVRRILTTLCAFALTLLANAQVGGGNPSLIDVVRHQVDYQGNMTTTDSDYSPNIAPAIEWLESSHSVNYIVYKMGDTIHGVTTFKNYNNFGVTYTATPEGSPALESPAPNAIVEASNGLITHEEYGLTYTITSGASGTLAANGGTASVSWTVTGVPNYLCAGMMYLPVKLILQDLDQEFTWHNHDELAGVSISRMVSSPVDTMSTPWGDFAYNVGLWGWGATNLDQAHQFLVEGIHYSERHYDSRVNYDHDHPNFYVFAALAADLLFDMKALIASLNQFIWTTLDCQDFASVLSYALEANGRAATISPLAPSVQPPGDGLFETTRLCPAGTDSTIDTHFVHYRFSFHMLCMTPEDKVSDAAASYRHNLSGGNHMNPVYIWGLPNYWQLNPSGSLIVGLAEDPYPMTYNTTWANLDRQAHSFVE